MLTTRTPATWQDLQNAVARILSECGFDVTVERATGIGRGQAEIDVYAEEKVAGRRNVIICECKNWKSAVPQSVVHGFRTVILEAGANTGYIIASKGFQSGAYEATERTNIKLVSWEEFQVEFEETWIRSHFIPVVASEMDDLMTYTEPFAPKWYAGLTEEDQQAYGEASRRHFGVGYLALSMSMWFQMYRQTPFPSLPLRAVTLPSIQPALIGIPDPILDAEGYADLLALMLDYRRDAVQEFHALRAKAGHTED